MARTRFLIATLLCVVGLYAAPASAQTILITGPSDPEPEGEVQPEPAPEVRITGPSDPEPEGPSETAPKVRITGPSDPEGAVPPETDAIDAALAGLGFTEIDIERLRTRVALDARSIEIAAALTERELTPSEVTALAIHHELFERSVESAVQLVLWVASGEGKSAYREYYEEQGITFTEYRNEYGSMYDAQWALYTVGGTGLLFSAGFAIPTALRMTFSRRELDYILYAVYASSAVVGAAVVLTIIDAYDLGNVPDGTYEGATKSELKRELGTLTPLAESAPVVTFAGFGGWFDGERGAATVMFTF